MFCVAALILVSWVSGGTFAENSSKLIYNFLFIYDIVLDDIFGKFSNRKGEGSNLVIYK